MPIVGELVRRSTSPHAQICDSIAGNRLTAGTKLKIEQFLKTFESLIRFFLPELIFGADETMVKRSNIDGPDCPKRREFVRREKIDQMSSTRQWTGVSRQEQGI
jgi:hypothetical protein